MNNINNNKFVSFLKKNNLKSTNQRYIIAKFLFDGENKHFTAEDLYEKIKSKKKVSLATIYNTLHSFANKKLLKKFSVKNGKTIFCTNMKNHYHFYNPVTDKFIDIPKKKINVRTNLDLPNGMQIGNIDVVVNLIKKN